MLELEVKQTKYKGRGVYAHRTFKAGEVIDHCPVIAFSEHDADEIEKTALKDYWFSWKDWTQDEYGCFVGGFGLFYNHSSQPNAKYEKDYDNKVIIIKALDEIPEGHEITIRYGVIWFKEEVE